jgi:hypothetical protein
VTVRQSAQSQMQTGVSEVQAKSINRSDKRSTESTNKKTQESVRDWRFHRKGFCSKGYGKVASSSRRRWLKLDGGDPNRKGISADLRESLSEGYQRVRRNCSRART